MIHFDNRKCRYRMLCCIGIMSDNLCHLRRVRLKQFDQCEQHYCKPFLLDSLCRSSSLSSRVGSHCTRSRHYSQQKMSKNRVIRINALIIRTNWCRIDWIKRLIVITCHRASPVVINLDQIMIAITNTDIRMALSNTRAVFIYETRTIVNCVLIASQAGCIEPEDFGRTFA